MMTPYRTNARVDETTEEVEVDRPKAKWAHPCKHRAKHTNWLDVNVSRDDVFKIEFIRCEECPHIVYIAQHCDGSCSYPLGPVHNNKQAALDEIVKFRLKRAGYRTQFERWYKGDLLIGENLQEAIEFLELRLPVYPYRARAET